MTENEAILIMDGATREEHLYMYDAEDRPYLIARAENMALNALKEIQAYREIGVVEEFKVLKEKDKPKKPVHDGCYDNEGVLHIWNGINGVPYDLCPNCKTNLCTDGKFGEDKRRMKYCKRCGQALDFARKESV